MLRQHIRLQPGERGFNSSAACQFRRYAEINGFILRMIVFFDAEQRVPQSGTASERRCSGQEPFAEIHMKVLRGLILAACLIFGSMPLDASNHKHERALKATFVLYGRSVKREIDHTPLCTAFAFEKTADGYNLITAGHCFIDTAPEDATYLVADGQVTDKPELQPIEVLNHIDDGVMDVAELHLKTAKKYEVLQLEKKPAKIDDKVFYVGYPEIVSQVIYTGRVSSAAMQTLGPDGSCGLCRGRFLVQTGGGPGASGSPIISEHSGKVIGILEGHIFENGVAVVPAPAIKAYLLKATMPREVK
jgi:Trypsin-like peptidase domain